MTFYISDKGDNNNDGLTRDTAIYSWELATKLAAGEAEIDMRDASRERVNDEIKKARKEVTGLVISAGNLRCC